jgi:hypothetical protein
LADPPRIRSPARAPRIGCRRVSVVASDRGTVDQSVVASDDRSVDGSIEVELADGTVGVGVSIGGEPACYLVEHHLARFVEVCCHLFCRGRRRQVAWRVTSRIIILSTSKRFNRERLVRDKACSLSAFDALACGATRQRDREKRRAKNERDESSALLLVG